MNIDYFSSFFFLLLQEVKFHTYENSSTHVIEKDAIAEVETRGCYAHQKQAYTVNILVPPTPPTDLSSSKIVHICYHLTVSLYILFIMVQRYDIRYSFVHISHMNR